MLLDSNVKLNKTIIKPAKSTNGEYSDLLKLPSKMRQSTNRLTGTKASCENRTTSTCKNYKSVNYAQCSECKKVYCEDCRTKCGWCRENICTNCHVTAKNYKTSEGTPTKITICHECSVTCDLCRKT